MFASELGLARTANGRNLVLAGYSAAPGTAAEAASLSTDVARVAGLVAPDGTVDTSTSLGSAFSGGSVRSAASADGTSFYVVGGNSGVQYVPLGGFSPTQIDTAPTNIRVVNIAAGNLYIATASNPYIGLNAVGSGLPTTGPQTVAVLPGFPATTTGSSPYGFYFADLSSTVAGIDVAYVADDRGSTGGGIQKWSLVAGSWVLNGTIAGSVTATVRGLDGTTTGTTVSLVATSPTGLYVLADNTGYNMAPTLTTLPAAVATALANTAFRGIAFAPTTPAPLIASFSPASGPVGTTVTVTGSNFVGATALTLNGTAVAGFTVVDASTITFAVPTGATSGTIAVTTPGGTATSTGVFTVIVPNPVPTITSLAPATAVAGAAGFTLTVNGTNFISGSVVSFNGTALVTTFGSATQLTAAVPASAVATAGTYNVTVTNAAPGGGTSAATTFTVTLPVPTIVSFTPTSGPVGTTVTVTGTNFTGATGATLNGLAVSNFMVMGATSVMFDVPTGATSGTIVVTTPGGTATSTATFTVIVPNPVPVITAITPNTAVAGAAVNVTIMGTGFSASSVVNINGALFSSAFVSATQLTGTVPVNTPAGTYTVTVVNPTPGGGTSNAVTFTLSNPVPTITSFTPTTGGPGTSITITGTNFTGATAVRIGSFNVPNFMVVSATSITLVLPGGTGSVNGFLTVTTPGGTATSAGTFNLVSATTASAVLTKLAAYPNPAVDFVTLTLPQAGAATVTLYDLAGRVVLASAPLAADQRLHLPASLQAGLYLLEVRQGATTAVCRIEKE